MSLVRNLNDRLSKKGNNIPFDNEYYFAISLAGDLRSLQPRARCLAKNEIQNVIFKHQMSASSFGESSKTSFNNSHSSGTIQPFNYSLPSSRPFSPTLSSPIANNSIHQFNFTPNSTQSKINQNKIARGAKYDLSILLHILDLL